MNWNPRLAELRDLFAELYPMQEDARRVVDDAGFSAAHIDFKDKPINNWHNILIEAHRRGQVMAIVVVARHDYPENPLLKRWAESPYPDSPPKPAERPIPLVPTPPILSPPTPGTPMFAPFSAGAPIMHPRQFFGRERELRRIFDLWKGTPFQNAAVIGPRRSGKSSLLFYLRNILTTPATHLRPGQRNDWLPEPTQQQWVYVDFQDPRIGTRDGLLRHILVTLNLPTPEICTLEGFLDITTQHWHGRVVILFDEINVALQRYPELDDTFWEGLRSLANNQSTGSLGFVLTSHTAPSKLVSQTGHSSPFFNIFGYTTFLGPLTEKEAHALIASSPITFADSDINWILEQSRCWPILVQILCRERLAALAEDDRSEAWRAEGVRQLIPFRHLIEQ